MAILDQSRDQNGQQLYQLLNVVGPDGVKLFNAPDFVSSAPDDRIRGNEKLAASVYADPRSLLFPCHSDSATWVSALFFHSQKQAMDRKVADAVEKRIDAAANFHGISGHIEALKLAFTKTAMRTEDELPDSDFALVVQWAGGEKERHLPMRNPSEVKAACIYLSKFRRELLFDDRRVMAEKILSKAASLGVDLGAESEPLEKQAGHGTCAPEKVAELLFSRAKAVRLVNKDLDMAEKLAGMATQCLDNPEFSTVPSNLHKIAAFVERVDTDYRLTNLTTLPRAEDTLFNLNVKVAQEILADHIALTTGTWYSKTALAKIGLGPIRDALGDQFANAISDDRVFLDLEKLAEIAPTLPRNDARIFDSMMAELRVEPVHREPNASGPLTEKSALFELAALHNS